ncbi:hypothetical protein D3C87_1042720 [compost metagenome]
MDRTKRFVTLKLLQLLSQMRSKTESLELIGITGVLFDELMEQISNTLFEVNGIPPAAANGLHLSLQDFLSGDIQDIDFITLINFEVNNRLVEEA